MTQFIILTIVVLVTLVANIFIDAYIIREKWGKIKNLNHFSRTVIRMIIFSSAIYFLGYSSRDSIDYLWLFIKSIWTPFVAGLYCLFLFGAGFDPLLNLLRKKEWHYKGKDALSDQMSWMINKKQSLDVARIELLFEILFAAVLACILLI